MVSCQKMASELTSDTVTSLTCLGFLPVGSHFGLLSIALNPIWGCLPGFTALPGEQVQKVLLLLGPVEDFFRFLWKKEKKNKCFPLYPLHPSHCLFSCQLLGGELAFNWRPTSISHPDSNRKKVFKRRSSALGDPAWRDGAMKTLWFGNKC